jgi:hypothetical protein
MKLVTAPQFALCLRQECHDAADLQRQLPVQPDTSFAVWAGCENGTSELLPEPTYHNTSPATERHTAANATGILRDALDNTAPILLNSTGGRMLL